MSTRSKLKSIKPSTLVKIDHVLGRLIAKFSNANKKRRRSMAERQEIRRVLLREVLAVGQVFELPHSTKLVKDFCRLLADRLQPLKCPEISTQLEAIRVSITKEIDEKSILLVPEHLQALYKQKEPPMGQRVLSAFPSARTDIAEAARCRALDRNTACIFHLMRALEVGMCALWRDTYGGTPGDLKWGSILAYFKRTAGEDPFFEDLVFPLTIIKDRWRNPTMHVDRAFQFPEVKEVFDAVDSLLNHMARRFQE